MPVQFRFAARSDVGLVRSNNQDAGYAGPHLLVLADGVGGYQGGDIASSVTVGHLSELDDVHRSEDLLAKLRAAIDAAQEDILATVAENPKLKGMGTTCIAILRSGNKLAMAHIGDSRAYLLRDQKLVQVTKDHTLVQYLVDHGQITPEEAESHPKKNVILRALGDSETEIELDESIREAIPGDRWLLCSDGLFGVVSRDRIAKTLADIDDPDRCAEKLIDLALKGGAPDNVTVVIADVIDTNRITRQNAPDSTPVVVGSASSDFDMPSRGSDSAAGKAAAYRSTPASPEEPDDEEAPPRKRRWPARLAVLIGLLFVAGGVLFGTWTWSQNQYYVYQSDGKVAIFKGVPQTLGPLSLSHEVDVTDVKITDLTDTAQQRLQEPVSKASLEDSEAFVASLEADHMKNTRDVKPVTQRGSGGVSGESPEAVSDALENVITHMEHVIQP